MAYLFSVASRTIRAADWLTSSFGVGMSSPATADSGWRFRQWVRKFASTFLSSVTPGFSVMRSSENTSRQSEQYQTNGVLVRSVNDTGIKLGMLTVSHRAVLISTPVDFKRHHYRNARWVQPSPCRIGSYSGPANCQVSLSFHPCLPFCSSRCKQQGPFAPRTLLRFIAPMDPSDSLSSSTNFPVSPVIWLPAPPFSRRDEEGLSSCLACPYHRAVALTPPE